jgi:hypothetical protein
MNPKLYVVVGVLSAIVGCMQLYQAIYDRPAGAGVSVFGIVVGFAFIAMGGWLITNRGRRGKPASRPTNLG